MRQELLNGDGTRLIVIESRQVLRRHAVQSDVALIDEELNRRAGQRLSHRTYVK